MPLRFALFHFGMPPRLLFGIRTGLALVLAYGVSLSMNWSNPQWAGIAVMSVGLESEGATLGKGGLRLLATVGAAVAALTMIALFPQERWAFFTALSLYVAFCGYKMLGSRYGYAWRVAAYVGAIIAINPGAPDGINDFAVAVERCLENVTGVASVLLVGLVVQPARTLPQLRALLEHLGTEVAVLLGPTSTAAGAPGQLKAELRGYEGMLQSAIGASFAIREQRHYWRVVGSQLQRLAATAALWHLAIEGLGERTLHRLTEQAAPVLESLQVRLGEVGPLLIATAFQKPTPLCPPVAPPSGDGSAEELSPADRGDLQVALATLERIERVSGTLWMKPCPPPQQPLTPAPWVPDPDHLRVAVRLALGVWIAALAWILVPDVPGGASLVVITTVFLVVLALAGVKAQMMLLPFLQSLAVGGLIYVLILPHLSGFASLGLLLFLCGFGFCLQYHKHPAKRTLSIDFLLISLAITNQQEYNFVGYLNRCLAIFLALGIIAITQEVPWSSKPHRRCFMLLRRLHSSCNTLLDLHLGPTAPSSWLAQWRLSWVRRQLTALPSQLAVLLPRLHPVDLGLVPTQLPTLRAGIEALALWSLEWDRVMETQRLSLDLPRSSPALGWRDLCARLEDVQENLEGLPPRPPRDPMLSLTRHMRRACASLEVLGVPPDDLNPA